MKKLTKNLLVLASSTVMATGCTSIMKKNEAQADADIKKNAMYMIAFIWMPLSKYKEY